MNYWDLWWRSAKEPSLESQVKCNHQSRTYTSATSYLAVSCSQFHWSPWSKFSIAKIQHPIICNLTHSYQLGYIDCKVKKAFNSRPFSYSEEHKSTSSSSISLPWLLRSTWEDSKATTPEVQGKIKMEKEGKKKKALVNL